MGTYETTQQQVSPNSSHSVRLMAVRFGEFLCQQDLITEEQLLEALGDHWSNGGNIGTAVHRQGFLGRDEIEQQAAAYHSRNLVLNEFNTQNPKRLASQTPDITPPAEAI